MLKTECTNCGTLDWAAKNDEYCTSCEREWWRAWTMTVCSKPNPKQAYADAIMEEIQGG